MFVAGVKDCEKSSSIWVARSLNEDPNQTIELETVMAAAGPPAWLWKISPRVDKETQATLTEHHTIWAPYPGNVGILVT
jgi:hypothetical protein